jgi:hypothetical protein
MERVSRVDGGVDIDQEEIHVSAGAPIATSAPEKTCGAGVNCFSCHDYDPSLDLILGKGEVAR